MPSELTPKRGVGGSNPLMDVKTVTCEHFVCGRIFVFACCSLRYAEAQKREVR